MFVTFNISQVSYMPVQVLRCSMVNCFRVVVRTRGLAPITQVPCCVDMEAMPVACDWSFVILLLLLLLLLMLIVRPMMVTHFESLETDMNIERSTRFFLPHGYLALYILLLIFGNGSVRLYSTYSDIVQTIFRIFW